MLNFGPRRGHYFDIKDIPLTLTEEEAAKFAKLDLIYRTLCGILFNFVPTSGHPGGSISSGRIVETILYKTADYDISSPLRDDNDMLIYAAGHKAMGLYAMYALRDEVVRAYNRSELPDENSRLRLEDLLGFRRNPTNGLPLFRKFNAKPLDGHPTPAVPFVKVATGASGIGVSVAFGQALGAMDKYDGATPFVHVLEGEGGMTPGRVSEALAAASAMRLYNIIFHVDFNQASIDSNRVCREGNLKGDYVQWDPVEFTYLHDFNVINVDDGTDFRKILAAQQFAKSIDTKMPTAIVYKTTKGWKYGIEGKGSHGAGHKFCSPEYYEFLSSFENEFNLKFPRFEIKSEEELQNEFGSHSDFTGNLKQVQIEQVFFDSLMVIRKAIESDDTFSYFSKLILDSSERVNKLSRVKRENAPQLEKLYGGEDLSDIDKEKELGLVPGKETTIRAALGSSLSYINKFTSGAVLGVAADLLGSTSLNKVGESFSSGFFDAVDNPGSRILSVGGICEDAMGGMMAGLSAYGNNLGVSSSYAAFISAMEHTDARLHCIGEQNRVVHFGGDFRTWVLVNAHTGLKTGEDGPTHADPQCLQLLQGNFPKGALITLIPWEPGEVWDLLYAGLMKKPAVLSPFVTRPNELVADREALGLAPAKDSVNGVYKLRKAKDSQSESIPIVLQESGVAIEFIYRALPKLDDAGYNVEVYYVSSSELFDLLPPEKQQEIFPEEVSLKAMGITGFTMPTMYRWIGSTYGRERIMFPFMKGHYLGSGSAESVLYEAGLDGDNIFKKVVEFIEGK